MMKVRGLQTKGVFALYCRIEAETITCGRLWVRDAAQLGKVVSLVQSDGSARFSVRLPENLPFESSEVELRREPSEPSV